MHVLAFLAVFHWVLHPDQVRAIAALASVGIPLLTGVLTKQRAHPGLKAVCTLGLAALNAGITTAVTASGNVVVLAFLQTLGLSWGTAVLSYYGLWKPSTVAAAVQGISPDFGLGAGPGIGQPNEQPLVPSDVDSSGASWRMTWDAGTPPEGPVVPAAPLSPTSVPSPAAPWAEALSGVQAALGSLAEALAHGAPPDS